MVSPIPNLAAEERLEQEREARVQHLLTVAARRFGKTRLAKSWSTWRDKYTASARIMRGLRRTAGRLMNAALARGWGTWYANSVARMRRRRLVRKGLARLAKPKL